MYIVVDGYNVLKQVLQKREISDRERQQFINNIRTYAQAKNHTITIVFDGGETIWPSRSEKYGVMIIYSGVKQSADDVIKQLIQQGKNKDLLLATSDNELINAAHASNLATIDAADFYRLLSTELQKPSSKKKDILIKTTKEQDSFIDALMQESKIPQERRTEDHYLSERKSQSSKLSKKERELLNKVKKL